MKKSVIVLATFISLLAGFISGPMSPANADPFADDAGITSLTFGSPNYFDYYGRRDTSELYPRFSTTSYNYQLATVADILDVNAVLSDPLATMKITFEGVTEEAQSSSDYRINLKPKVSLLDIEVTAQDGVTTKHYLVNISNQILQAPELVSMSSTSGSWIGGMPLSFRVKNANLATGSVNCYVRANFTITDQVTGDKSVFNQYIASQQGLAPDENGVTTIGTFLSYNWAKPGYTGEAVVSLTNQCDSMSRSWGNFRSIYSETGSSQKFTFLPYAITEAVIPSTLTGGSVIEFKGTGIYASSQFETTLTDEASGEQIWIYSVGEPISAVRGVEGSWKGSISSQDRQTSFRAASKKLLTVGYWKYNPVTDQNERITAFSRVVNWKPTLPTSVVISPAKGDISGGKRVRVEGYNLCNQNNWPNIVDVRIDGKPLTNIEMQYGNSYCGDVQNNEGKPIKNWLTGIVPEGTSTGVKSVTVDNGNGLVKVSATYTYGATPDITSIDQTAVAATGGSKIRITGHNFGFSGTPIVIIGGKKSPKVTLISDSQMDVIVPFDLSVGSQAINVVSSSGGGANLVPASINVVAASKTPTFSSLSATQGLSSGGDVVTINVGNLGTPSTVGVMFGINPAEVTRVTATQIDVKVPAGSAGATSLTISTSLGQLVVANAYTYNAIAAVKSVTPSTVASTADVAGRTVTITGVGFGASGTIKIGELAPRAYVSTEGGTVISNVVIPNETAGSLAILITPSGSLAPLATSVTVTRPKMTYVGTVVDDARYNLYCAANDWNCIYGAGTIRPSLSKTAGNVLKIKGTGFGTSGTVKVGALTITPTSYSDLEIIVELPAMALGKYDITVVPSTGLKTDILTSAISIIEAADPTRVEITGVAPTVPNTRGDELYNFDPSQDVSSIFKITGRGFLGDDNGVTTKVYQLDNYQDPRYPSEGRVLVNILSITDTEITFSAVRTFNPTRWTGVAVVTSEALTFVRAAIQYVGNRPASADISGYYGLCTKDAIKTHNPAVVTVSGSGMFGEAGSVNLSGQAIDPAAVTWTSDSVSIDFSKLPADLAEHWGQQSIEFVPGDSALISRSFNWFCGVWAEVETKLNGSTADLTISAGDDLVASATFPTAKRLNEVVPNDVWPTDGGYQYQSAEDHARQTPWSYNVRSGLPTYAGDWYVRANPGVSTTLIDRGIYSGVSSNDVHLTISGTAITFTPKLKGSSDSSIVYRGQLGDGTNDSNDDIAYVVDVPAGAPKITSLNWEYRNHTCAVANNDYGWNQGLPANVAVIPNECGGDGSASSSWDIRVGSFQMMKDGKDQAMFYVPTFNIFNLTITKRALTIDKVSATKPFDGNANIYLGALTVSGAIEGETPTLQGNESRNGYFSDATVGDNKPVYVADSNGQTDFIQRIKLEGTYDWNYYLTNSELLVLGSITKANAKVSLSASNLSLILSVIEQSNITALVRDTATGNAPIDDAHVSDLVVTVSTPSICSISADLVVTAKTAGECIVQASQAASVNYNAATAVSDPDSTVETLTINIFAEPRKVSVITQDLVVAQGDSYAPGFETVGLADGDALESVVFDYYDGATKLDGAPTEPGRYTMVGVSANIVTNNLAAYNSDIEYVVGLLLITSPPPTISGYTPANGSQAGGEKIVITGANLNAVTSIKFGDVVISNSNFTVNGDGTEITLYSPPGSGNVTIVLTAGESQLQLDYSYDPVVATAASVAPETGRAIGGNIVVVTGTHLELVTEVRFGNTTISSANLVRNENGTSISFAAPAGSGKVKIILVAESGNMSFDYTYEAPATVTTTVTTVAPNNGRASGGNIVIATGTHLDLVSEVRFGNVTISGEDLVRNENGTTISFAAPAGSGKVTIVLVAPSGDSSIEYTYAGSVDRGLQLSLVDPEFGKTFSGQKVRMTAKGLKPGADYTLNMYSKQVAMVTGIVSPDGSINSSMVIPAKACVKPGLHRMILESEDEAGEKYRSTIYVVLGENCALNALAVKAPDKSWNLKGISFDYRKWDLTQDKINTLIALKPWLQKAKSVTVAGYTHTDGKGVAMYKSNKILAKNRALAVAAIFKSLGLKAKFLVDPVGPKNPISKVQSKNQRAELKITF